MQLLPATPLDAPVFPDFFKQPLQPRDFFLHMPAIGFELRLAWPAGADAGTLPGKVRPHAGQPRQHVFQLRQLDLNFAFARPGALCENIENQFRPINHLHLRTKNLAKVPALCRREIIVKNHRVGSECLATSGNFGDLALANKGRRARRVAFLGELVEDGNAGGFGEFPEFFE